MLLLTPRKSHTCGLSISIFKFELKVKVKIMHIFTANISMVQHRANIIIAIKYDVAYGLSISIYLDLTFGYSEGQLGRMNGVSPN